MSSLMWV